MHFDDDINHKLPGKAKPQEFYTLPDGYFERFPVRMNEKIQANRREAGRSWFLPTYVRYASIAVAATLLLLIVTLLPSNETSGEVSDSTLYLSDLQDDEIFDLYTEFALTENSFTQYDAEEQTTIQEYLLENTNDPYEYLID